MKRFVVPGIAACCCAVALFASAADVRAQTPPARQRVIVGMRNDRSGCIGPADRDENRRAFDQLTERRVGRTRISVFSGQSVPADRLRFKQHTIDVFVRPATGGKPAPSPATATLRGFNVAHATGTGMEWWGVSDVSADVLQSLVARLARGPE